MFLPSLLKKWEAGFDTINGGTKGAPKFMLPNNWQFLFSAGIQFQDEKILKQVKLTLQKMAFSGLYDQIGGGFARYSTDEIWKVPHFEKMLYDNAQLLSLLCGGLADQSRSTLQTSCGGNYWFFET